MSPGVLEKIHQQFSQYPRRHYPKGQILVFPDENPAHIFYVTKGRVRQYDVSYRGDEIVINTFKPPAFFPMSWALNQTPNKYFYKAETGTDLHIVPAAAAAEFLAQNPDVTLDLLARLYRGLEGVYERLAFLMSGTAYSRLLHALLLEARRFGELQSDGSTALKASETDLAALAGMSRETVSREMRKLKTKGLVRVTAAGVFIQDVASLEQALARAA